MKAVRFWLLSGAIGCAFVQSVPGAEAAEWTVLHSFGSGSDGAYPSGSLININGNLYGTTSAGGTYSNGTVFELAPDGTETVLHSFVGWPSTDGTSPDGLIANKAGTLFGTTARGGKGQR